MKKIAILVTALLVGLVVTAQELKVVKNHSALSFNLGPALPVGDFSSTNENNDNAGFAVTGVNLNVNYDYKFVKNAGLGFDFFYASHNIEDNPIHDVAPNSSADHYQYWGVIAGPMISADINPKTNVNFRLMGGIASCNSPEFIIQGTTAINGDWKSSFAWKLDGDVRFNFSKNAFFMVNVGYLETRPNFDLNVLGESGVVEIHINTINLNAGVGIKF